MFMVQDEGNYDLDCNSDAMTMTVDGDETAGEGDGFNSHSVVLEHDAAAMMVADITVFTMTAVAMIVRLMRPLQWC